MKERPILFSAPMVRAILEGRKTQTRRVVKPVGNDDGFILQDSGKGLWPYRSDDGESCFHTVKRSGKEFLDETPMDCPYGTPGDRLWVRESWAHDGPDLETVRSRLEDALPGGELYGPYYRATEEVPETLLWRPSIHMPRWASRIDLEITGVRVERLQDISEEEAKAESAEPYRLPVHPARECLRYVDGFTQLWESINGPGSWDANPYVWCIEFKRI